MTNAPFAFERSLGQRKPRQSRQPARVRNVQHVKYRAHKHPVEPHRVTVVDAQSARLSVDAVDYVPSGDKRNQAARWYIDLVSSEALGFGTDQHVRVVREPGSEMRVAVIISPASGSGQVPGHVSPVVGPGRVESAHPATSAAFPRTKHPAREVQPVGRAGVALAGTLIALGMVLLIFGLAFGLAALYAGGGVFFLSQYAAHGRGETVYVYPGMAATWTFVCFALGLVSLVAGLTS